MSVRKFLKAFAFPVFFTLMAVAAFAQSNRATFPANFDKYVRYAVYDRGSSKEEAFATPETLEIAKSGKPLPPGTQLVLGTWQNNRLTDCFVMESRVALRASPVSTVAFFSEGDGWLQTKQAQRET